MPSPIRGSDNFDSAKVFAQNQTRQDVSSGRFNATPETNNTGRPIWVHVALASSASNQVASATIGGIAHIGTNAAQAGNSSAISFVVLDGETYSVSIPNFQSILSWVEIR